MWTIINMAMALNCELVSGKFYVFGFYKLTGATYAPVLLIKSHS
jgi:hypothetical protein